MKMFVSQKLQASPVNSSISIGISHQHGVLLQRCSRFVFPNIKNTNLIKFHNPLNEVVFRSQRFRKLQYFAISNTLDCFTSNEGRDMEKKIVTGNGQETILEKNFWGAVSLIIGTAVGPGMLGLPAVTIKSGPLPSTCAILLSWVYVISSIILVAELSFAAMNEDGVAEVSYTGLASKTLGSGFGTFVSLVYASLSFSLLVACVSGIGSIVSQCFPWINPVVANALFPSLVGTILYYFSFKAIDAFNRSLCILMLLSITSLVAIGLFVGRTNILSSFTYASWSLSSVLPAIPVTVLTLGFHVITPFICKIAGNNVNDARKAIIIGGTTPMLMVLSWNLIVLGLAGTRTGFSVKDPISLLLSVNSSALSAVQSFAFSALATSLIGYAVSFPKQVTDTFELVSVKSNLDCEKGHELHTPLEEVGKIGAVNFTSGDGLGKAGQLFFGRFKCHLASNVLSVPTTPPLLEKVMMPLVLGIPIVIASFFPSAFARALDYAGVYANCFLFGILPPVMTYLYQSRQKKRYATMPNLIVSLGV
ncbi:hypothetical protein Leryth_001227 [Lithospermum erythrorhizon]|nr:hypothetical protein Leryth_001227 [Lithospermum erythrorhizon]